MWTKVENGKMPSRCEYTLDTVLKAGVLKEIKSLRLKKSKGRGKKPKKLAKVAVGDKQSTQARGAN